MKEQQNQLVQNSSSVSVVAGIQEQHQQLQQVVGVGTGNTLSPGSDSNYDDDEEEVYEEVGFEDYNQKYDDDEGEIIVPQKRRPSQPSLAAQNIYSYQGNQRRGSLGIGMPLNELSDNVKETDGEDEYSEIDEDD